MDYFKNKNDPFSNYCFQQLSLALATGKQKNDTRINPIAVESLRKYKDYANEKYPMIIIGNNTDSGKVNGWWVKIKVSLKKASIHHKTEDGHVDLSIYHGAENFARYKSLEKWLNEIGYNDIHVVKTQKSASFRINVPPIHMGTPFDQWTPGDLDKCLYAATRLTELANMFAIISDVFT